MALTPFKTPVTTINYKTPQTPWTVIFNSLLIIITVTILAAVLSKANIELQSP